MSEDTKEKSPKKAQVEALAKHSTTPKKTQGIKSRERVRDAGEVFTQPREVKAMCDLCEPTISEIDKKVLEPTCGNGNFLVEILKRKLEKTNKNHYKALIAISNIYGVDIARDNLEEARNRMKGVILDYFKGEKTPAPFLMAVDTILRANICYGNMLTGRKKIKLINWIPDDKEGFELEPWIFSDIEKLREKTKSATTIEDITKIYEEIQNPPIATMPKKKPKPKPKVAKQGSLF